MKTMFVGIMALSMLVIAVAACTVYGGAAWDSVKEKVDESTPVEFDIKVAKNKVKSLKQEIVDGHRDLLAMERDIARTEEDIGTLRERILYLENQSKKGIELRNQKKDAYMINGVEYTFEMVDQQVRSYLNEIRTKRNMLNKKQGFVLQMRQKVAENERKLTDNKIKVEEYESRLALAEIDAKFRSHVDQYNVIDGSTEIESDIDAIEDQLAADKIMGEGNTAVINFTGEDEQSTEDMAKEVLGEY